MGDPDSHWHITVGNWILAHGAVPTVDSYSFTFAGQPWIAKEWLSQVVMALAYNAGGWGGVVGAGAAAIGFTFALLLRLLLRDLRPLPALLFTAAALVMTAPHFLARPHVLAFPFMLLWVAGLVRAVEERRAPEPLLLLACCCGPTCMAASPWACCWAARSRSRPWSAARDCGRAQEDLHRLAKFGVAALLVACITPYGPESILVTFAIFSLGDALALISEWRSPDFQKQPLQELMLLVALYLGLSRGLKLPFDAPADRAGAAPPVPEPRPQCRAAGDAGAADRGAGSGTSVADTAAHRRSPAGSLLRQRLAALGRPAGRNAIALCLVLGAVYAAGVIDDN